MHMREAGLLPIYPAAPHMVVCWMCLTCHVLMQGLKQTLGRRRAPATPVGSLLQALCRPASQVSAMQQATWGAARRLFSIVLYQAPVQQQQQYQLIPICLHLACDLAVRCYAGTCPVAADNARLGNGVCDGELNIPACKYDGGDCCSTTCQRSPLVLDGCRPDKFDCRDPAASVDTQAPKLFGVPSNYSVVAESRLNATQQPVLAVDNFPCFDPDTQVTTQVLTPHPRTHACDSKILYYVERSWEATDRVGNTGSASAVLTVLDDQVVDPLVASFTVPKGSSKKPKFRTVVLNLDARPNKRYVWTVRPWAGGQVVTREGE